MPPPSPYSIFNFNFKWETSLYEILKRKLMLLYKTQILLYINEINFQIFTFYLFYFLTNWNPVPYLGMDLCSYLVPDKTLIILLISEVWLTIYEAWLLAFISWLNLNNFLLILFQWIFNRLHFVFTNIKLI